MKMVDEKKKAKRKAKARVEHEARMGKRVRIEMNPGKDDKNGWWDFAEVEEGEAEIELRKWREENPGTQFRIAEKKKNV